MSRFAILVALACGVACGPKHAERAADPSVPKFAGTVGQLDEGNQFLTFIGNHQSQTVALDLQFPDSAYQGTEESGSSTFDVWEECDNLPEGQKPGPLSGGCTGFEFHIPFQPGSVRVPARDGAVWRLRGQFRVEPAGGPLQGLMAISLTPVATAPGGGGR